MSDEQLAKWLELYGSSNRTVKLRAAKALVAREDTPTEMLFEILVNLWNDDLGQPAVRALLRRADSGMVDRLLELLQSNASFVRQVASHILGVIGDPSATEQLLAAVDDPDRLVRHSAALALVSVGNRRALPRVRELYAAHRDDDINVVLALRTALKRLGESAGHE